VSAKGKSPWESFTNSLFVLPALGMFLTFSVYPLYKVFELSVFHWDGISSATLKFAGLANYAEVFLRDGVWWLSMRNAAVITFLALTFQNALALALAWIVDRDIKGGQIYRTIFFLPPILSGIVVGLIWNWIYMGDFGLLNHILQKAGLGNLSRAWLADPRTALTALAVIHMWKGFGWGFIILLAGLQGIPRELYESARVDGANEWRIFWKITVPLMIPVFILVSVLTILGTMQIYDLVVSTTGGGPGYHTEVPMTRIIAKMLASARFGYACALGIVFGLILLLLSLVQIQISKRVRAD
jgi:raffinose/stachyose/melibiose transport system permease protein